MAAPTGGYFYQAVTPVGLAHYLPPPVQRWATCRALAELGFPHRLMAPLVRVGPCIWEHMAPRSGWARTHPHRSVRILLGLHASVPSDPPIWGYASIPRKCLHQKSTQNKP
jgi:hypothetical protein